MRIELNSLVSSQLESSGSSSRATGTEHSGRQEDSDVARLSTGSDTMQALKTRLQAVPEVRQDKVTALQSAIAAGSYSISPQQIAASMLSEIDG